MAAVSALLASGPISDEDRGEAIRLAAANSHQEIVRLLSPKQQWKCVAFGATAVGIAILGLLINRYLSL